MKKIFKWLLKTETGKLLIKEILTVFLNSLRLKIMASSHPFFIRNQSIVIEALYLINTIFVDKENMNNYINNE